jgi:hypothetical protein
MEQHKQQKINMGFETWNVRILYRSDRKPQQENQQNVKPILMGLQKVRLDKSGSEPSYDHTTFCRNWNEVYYRKASAKDSLSPGRDLNQKNPE